MDSGAVRTDLPAASPAEARRPRRLRRRNLPARITLWVILAAAVVVLAVVLVRTAWITDDAYITFRTVDNFVHGYGLRWNVAERVQSYTHPLWMFIIAGAYALSGNVYYTAIAAGLFCTVATVLLLTRYVARDVGVAAGVIITLTASRAFVDFSTSGLENPLSHMLLVLFFLQYHRTMRRRGGLFSLSLVGTLLVLNRMDAVLLCGPAVVYALWRRRSVKAVGQVVLGGVPFFLWEAFSLFYYGSLVPNTAYAKLGTGIAATDLAGQGVYFLWHSVKTDPLTCMVILAGLTAPISRLWRREWPFALGVLLHILYVIKVGGDFMTGRFLTAPFVCCVTLLAYRGRHVSAAPRLVVMTAVVAVALFAPSPQLTSGPHYGHLPPGPRGRPTKRRHDHGIGDARAVYYEATGLLRETKHRDVPDTTWVRKGLVARKRYKVRVIGHVGFFGYYAGPGVHVVDPRALSDPLLARLPARYNPHWRIGHFDRVIPDGYLATVGEGRNLLTDKQLARFYDKVCIITRHPLAEAGRFSTIVNMLLGRYDSLIRTDVYRKAPEVSRSPASAGAS